MPYCAIRDRSAWMSISRDIVVRLLHPDIDQARHLAAQLFQKEVEPILHRLAFIALRPHDLHVDRGRNPEVQDLTDDIGGREREHRAGKIVGQPDAQFLDVAGGGVMALVETYM